MECQEKLLDNIVRIDFYDMQDDAHPILLSIPSSVPFVHEMVVYQGEVNLVNPYNEGIRIDMPALSLQLSGDGCDGLMGMPTHKTSEKRDAQGTIRNHTLTIPVEEGYETIKSCVDAVNGKALLCVLTLRDESRRCVHVLPQSSALVYEDTIGGDHEGTLKYTAQSLSWLVRLAYNQVIAE